MAVCWDTLLSPVDVRSLTAAQRAKDGQGAVFFHDRTGRAAAGTLSHRAERLLDPYLTGLGVELHADAPLFRNRSGLPYSKDTLGDDFREIRRMVFPGDKRTLMDFRRSGAVEAVGGQDDELNRSVERFAAHTCHRQLGHRMSVSAKKRAPCPILAPLRARDASPPEIDGTHHALASSINLASQSKSIMTRDRRAPYILAVFRADSVGLIDNY